MSTSSVAAHLNIEIPKKPAGKSASEHRRATKPIMEKRRRARINHSLNELKSLILDALNKDPTRNSKLEKADILEMTVRHLQSLQRQQMALEVARDPTVLSKYKAGFSECATEVQRYVSKIEGVDNSMKSRLVSHLNNCVQAIPALPSSGQTSSGISPSPLQVHIPHGLFTPSAASTTSSSSSSSTSSSCSDMNNNSNHHHHPHIGHHSMLPKMTPPASASSTFSFNFPPSSSSLSSPLTPTTPITPDFRFNPYGRPSMASSSSSSFLRRDYMRSMSPASSSSSMGSLSPSGSDSIDVSVSQGEDVWRPW